MFSLSKINGIDKPGSIAELLFEVTAFPEIEKKDLRGHNWMLLAHRP